MRYSSVDHAGDALLFTAPDGGVLRYSNWLRRVWWPAAVAAGLGRMAEDKATGMMTYEGLGFHDLRRANATGLVAAGVDVKTAQGAARALGLPADPRPLRPGGHRARRPGGRSDGREVQEDAARDNRAIEGDSDPSGTRPRTRLEGL